MNEDKLISILRYHSDLDQILESHSIVNDLKLNGDDADELYFDLLDNYGVDLKKLGYLEECFHSEGELLDFLHPIKSLLHKIGLRSEPPIRQLSPLFVSDLLNFIRTYKDS